MLDQAAAFTFPASDPVSVVDDFASPRRAMNVHLEASRNV